MKDCRRMYLRLVCALRHAEHCVVQTVAQACGSRQAGNTAASADRGRGAERKRSSRSWLGDLLAH
jgi:hypothetical protein